MLENLSELARKKIRYPRRLYIGRSHRRYEMDVEKNAEEVREELSVMQ